MRCMDSGARVPIEYVRPNRLAWCGCCGHVVATVSTTVSDPPVTYQRVTYAEHPFRAGGRIAKERNR